MARLKEYYKDTVVKELTEQFSYQNPMQVPKITKIVLNIGSGEFSDKKTARPKGGCPKKVCCYEIAF